MKHSEMTNFNLQTLKFFTSNAFPEKQVNLNHEFWILKSRKPVLSGFFLQNQMNLKNDMDRHSNNLGVRDGRQTYPSPPSSFFFKINFLSRPNQLCALSQSYLKESMISGLSPNYRRCGSSGCLDIGKIFTVMHCKQRALITSQQYTLSEGLGNGAIVPGFSHQWIYCLRFCPS